MKRDTDMYCVMVICQFCMDAACAKNIIVHISVGKDLEYSTRVFEQYKFVKYTSNASHGLLCMGFKTNGILYHVANVGVWISKFAPYIIRYVITIPCWD